MVLRDKEEGGGSERRMVVFGMIDDGVEVKRWKVRWRAAGGQGLSIWSENKHDRTR